MLQLLRDNLRHKTRRYAIQTIVQMLINTINTDESLLLPTLLSHGGSRFPRVVTGSGLPSSSSWSATAADCLDKCPASTANQQADTHAG